MIITVMYTAVHIKFYYSIDFKSLSTSGENALVSYSAKTSIEVVIRSIAAVGYPFVLYT